MTQSTLPQHIAIIMDGNGRWAKQRFLPRAFGHRAGVETVRKIVKSCAQKQIKVLSLFAFSSENWRRPQQEVNDLMDLFLTNLHKEVKELHENHLQLRFIGNRSHFNDELRKKIDEVEQLTSKNKGMVLVIATDYGGQWDIYQAVQRLIIDIEAGKLSSKEMTEKDIANRLSFADLPDPDLFIRTSGELRISNFMLWQLAYTELYFTPTLWPDFDDNELEQALNHFNKRERRYGLSGDQIKQTT